jgi:hypothetical protein
MLLVWAPLASLSLAGPEHGRTIPLADITLMGHRHLSLPQSSTASRHCPELPKGLSPFRLALRFASQAARAVR